MWLLLNHFSSEDEEQAVGLEKADLVQPADLICRRLQKPLALPPLRHHWNAPALGGGGSLWTVGSHPSVQGQEERLPLSTWNSF